MKLTLLNEGISVRTCNARDVDTLMALSIKTFRDTFDEYNDVDNMFRYINDNFTKKVIEQEMKQPGTVYFLAQDGRKAVGYAKVRSAQTPPELDGAPVLELQRLYVQREYKGKRIGHLLLQTCLAHARKKGTLTMWLGVWEHNEHAIRFYERHGFKRFSEHTFMLGNDAQTDWLMKREV